ncbi:MAG: hypothetical protein DCF31_03970 [Alphaproteobacteria bacterium]|nr:MAG: hypothetical protein DCF31_03970 [Alphaproteobacteria bacterium]
MFIDWDGQALPARPGESLLATLTAAGITTLRHDGQGAAQGAWCGMGACQACLVNVDGMPNRRACMVKVAAGMTAAPATERAKLHKMASAPPRRAADLPERRPDVLVIGAGPAGLSAALVARRAGLNVLLVDERGSAGGQYYKQPDIAGMPIDAQATEGAALIARVQAAGVEILSETTVWGAFAGLEFAASRGGAAFRIRPRAVVVATGAQETAWPVPGWTLPGVMSTGAAQGLLRTAGRIPPGRIVIAGNGPLNLQLAAELLAAGADVAALVEAAPAPGLGRVGTVARMAAAAPGLVRRGIAYRARLRRAGVPTLWATQVTSIAAGLEIETDGGERLAADMLCLGYGLVPETALPRALGAMPGLSTNTMPPGVFIAGDCTTIGGAHVAAAAGTLAGAAAARYLGLAADPGEAQARMQRAAAFQAALWRLYAPARPLLGHITPTTIICRCEGVTAEDIAAAQAAGAYSHAAIKQATRLGMGRCQGRGCVPLLARLSPESVPVGLAPRAPVRPVTIAELAG